PLAVSSILLCWISPAFAVSQVECSCPRENAMSVAEVPPQPPTAVTDPAKGKAVVLYDGMCPLCQRAVRTLKRLDWFKRLHYQDCRDTDHWPPSAVPLELKKLLAEMHVV